MPAGLADNPTLTLRPYQQDALEAIHAGWQAGNTRVAVVLPTGTGKTVVMAHLAKTAHRPLILVHRDELVRQTVTKLEAIIPGAVVGVVKAERNELGCLITVASVQTLTRPNRRAPLPIPGMVLVDEAHHAAAASWQDVLHHFGSFAVVPTVGFSATLGRNDNKKLGDTWQEVVYKQDILEAISAGWLVDVKAKQLRLNGLDLGAVATTAGDYQDGSLGTALEDPDLLTTIVSQWHQAAAGRPTLAFCPTVYTAHALSAVFLEAGIRAETVTGETPTEERQAIYARSRRGETAVISSCMVLTEGFDAPWLSCAIMARPTTSSLLYTQMAGRILRPFPGKQDALLLDVVGVAGKLQLATIADLTTGAALTVQPGETLTEASVRWKQSVGILPNGRITLAEVDLFQRSRAAWLVTYGGVYFIPAKTGEFFLAPASDDTWRVGWKGRTEGKWLTPATPSFDMAMSRAEAMAYDLDPSLSKRAASWRRKPATDKQKEYACYLGIEPSKQRCGELSDAISIALASPWLDTHFAERSVT